jgi:hydrogenase maturation protease
MKPLRTVIIGYGNTLRSDDGFGCIVVDLLEERGILKNVEYITSQQLLPEMAESLRHSQLVIFLDASVAEKTGALSIEFLHPGMASGTLSHHLNPASLLALVQSLYQVAPQAYLLSIGTEDFEFGEILSGPVKAMLPVAAIVVEAIANQIETIMEGKENDKNIDAS